MTAPAWRWAAGFAAGAVALVAASTHLHRHHVRLLAPFAGYTRPLPFDLRDSLPALEGGLSDLEAFTVHVPGARRANFDRTLWIAPRADSLVLAYVTDRDPHADVRLVTWTDDPVFTVHADRARSVTRTVHRPAPVRDWIEVVAAFIARPARIRYDTGDPAVVRFERAEGRTLHLVGGAYRPRRLRVTPPDTTYPVTGRNSGQGDPLVLLARGDALAVISQSREHVRLRVVFRDGEGRIRRPVVEAAPGMVRVYRTALAGAKGTILAYTHPGILFPLRGDRKIDPPEYFIAER